MSSHIRATNLRDIIQYPNERVAVLVPRRQAFFPHCGHHLIQDKYLPLRYLEFVSLVSHPPYGCQGRQEGVPL